MIKDHVLLPFAGELMLPRVVRLLSEVVEPILVVAALGFDFLAPLLLNS